jgi:GH18 family chitinase
MKLFILVLLSSIYARTPISGYVAAWENGIQNLPYEKLEMALFSFGIPTPFGHITVSEPSKLEVMVAQAHAKGCKAMLAVGGWNLGDGGGDDTRFEKLAQFPKTRANFVSSALEYIEEYNLDGIDLDWEYPDVESAENWNTLVQELGTALHAKGKLLTAAVAAIGPNAMGISEKSFAMLDRIHLMVYDDDKKRGHSSIAYAKESIAFWSQRGVPKAKLWLGVPFYGKQPYTPYKSFVNQAVANPEKDCLDGFCYTGPVSMAQKVAIAQQEQMGGIMIWEMHQDAEGEHSLLDIIEKSWK